MISFTKMHGLGNDFVVFDAINQSFSLQEHRIRTLADRRFGIGCDQILLVEPPRDPDTDFFYRIFNADGSEVEQCGNGARCFARFVRDKGLSRKDTLEVGTRAGKIRLILEADGRVRVNMGFPVFDAERIPFVASGRAPTFRLEVDGATLEIAVVSMGNPHAVLKVASVASAPVTELGPLIERHARFPQKTNVGFMQILDRHRIKLRVFERGVGETLACGTGACAAVVAARRQGLVDAQVGVNLPGGDLVIKWGGENEPVWMSGPATRVFEGKIDL